MHLVDWWEKYALLSFCTQAEKNVFLGKPVCGENLPKSSTCYFK